MNEVLKAIESRYSCRDFTGEPLTKDQADALVKAALAAPSAVNRQPWFITVVTDKALLDEMDAEAMRILAEMEDQSGYQRMMGRGGKVFYNAHFMMLVTSPTSKPESEWAMMDVGILSENVCLAAQSLGLGNIMIGMARIPLNGPKGEEYKKRLKIPEGYTFGMAILAGVAKSSKEPHELDYGKVAYVH